MQMYQITESQIEEMNLILIDMMNTRLDLTRVSSQNQSEINKGESNKGANDEDKNDEDTNYEDNERNEETEKDKDKISKYIPPLTWKEHKLGHQMQDIRNLGQYIKEFLFRDQ
jgi:hypothetical protein